MAGFNGFLLGFPVFRLVATASYWVLTAVLTAVSLVDCLPDEMLLSGSEFLFLHFSTRLAPTGQCGAEWGRLV